MVTEQEILVTNDTPVPARIVLIGCGEVATSAHLPALTQLRREGVLDVVGVCDLDAQRAETAARRHEIHAWGTDWTRVVRESSANAVAVCTLPGVNAAIAAAALEAGLHVLCEKPPGRNEADAVRMAAAAALRSHLVTMIAFNRRFAPLTRRLSARSLELGAPHSFAARFTRRALGRAPSNGADDWVSSDGSHAIDLALATIGVPHQLTVARSCIGTGPDNAWLIHLVSAQGHATIWLDFAAGQRLERFEWAGPGYDASLELPNRATWSSAATTTTWRGSDLSGSDDIAINYGFCDEYRAFVAAIGGVGARPVPDFAYGAVFMRIIGLILTAKTGETRRVELATPSVHQVPVKPNVRAARPRPTVAVLQPPAAMARFFAPNALAELGALCDLRLPAPSDPFAHVVDTEAVLLGWGAPALPAEVFAGAPRLELALVLGAAVQWALPREALQSGRLTVRNTADAIAQSVAEHCLLLTLAGLRRLTAVDRAMHGGSWPTPRPAPGILRKTGARVLRRPRLHPVKRQLKRVLARPGDNTDGSDWRDLRGQTVGLVGWGHIARRFAELLRPFDCSLLVASEHADDDALQPFRARRASLGEVFATSRVVSLHKILDQTNRGLIGRQLLAAMPAGSVFVNTARAGLVDDAALLERARQGNVVIALDVFEPEPLPKRHPLRRSPNAILTPHNASATPECARRVGDEAVSLIRSWAGTPDRV